MSESAVVSILCTAYNHEKYIRQTLDGFLAQQTDFPYEIIIHDDASTDATADIIREYADRYPKVFKPIYQSVNQYSQNVNIDREFLRPLAAGKYIAYCEGDDYWTDPHKLQKQVDFLETHPGFSATAHNCIFVNEKNEEIPCIYPMYREYRSHVFTLRRFSMDVVYPGQTASLLYRKSAYDFDSAEQEAAFYGMRVSTGDKRTILKLLLAGDIFCFEEKMSAYRIVTQGGDSWTASNYGKNLSYKWHIASIDFRKYVRKYGKKSFHNYYSTFHTGVAGIGKYLLKPNEQNKEVCRQTIEEHGGVLGTTVYLIGMGILSIPFYFLRKIEKKKYDPKRQGEIDGQR